MDYGGLFCQITDAVACWALSGATAARGTVALTSAPASARCGGPRHRDEARKNQRNRARPGAEALSCWGRGQRGSDPTHGGPGRAQARPLRGRSPSVNVFVFRDCGRLAVTVDMRHHVFDSRADLGSVKARR